MTTPSRTTMFRRVVIGFRDTCESSSSLEATARFAQLIETELLGVFIEDTELMEWSGSPLMRQFTSISRPPVPASPARLAEEFSAAADMMRRRFARAAATLGVRARFQIERSSAATLEIKGAGPEDLLVVVEPADPMARLSYPFTTVLEAVAKSQAPVLYMPNQVRQRTGPVVSVFRDADDQGHRIAADLASRLGEDMIDIRFSEDELPQAEAAAKAASGRAPASVEHIRHALDGVRECLIVFSRQVLGDHDPSLFVLLAAERRVPLLIVGAGPPASP